MKVLDVEHYEGSIESAIQVILDNMSNDNNCISLSSAHGLIEAKRRPAFKKILDSFYLNLADGMPSVWVARLKGAKSMKRCYGPAMFQETMLATSDKTVKHFLCGGKHGVAEQLMDVCKEEFGNQNIVCTYCPEFLPVEKYAYEKIAEMINETQPDIVWIGLSTPKQEEFAYRLSQFTSVSFLICVGAAFDFHTGRLRQAPEVIQMIGMEWLFRLFVEPKRLWRRYFQIVPLFIWLNLKELLFKRIQSQ